MSCIFCKIACYDAPANIIYEDDHCLAFLSIQPITPGHVLVIPKVHANRFGEIPSEVCVQMMQAGQHIARALCNSELQFKERRCEGVNLFLCDGPIAGQTIAHAHLHVLARFVGDGFGFNLTHDHVAVAQPSVLVERAEHLRALLRLLPQGSLKALTPRGSNS